MARVRTQDRPHVGGEHGKGPDPPHEGGEHGKGQDQPHVGEERGKGPDPPHVGGERGKGPHELTHEARNLNVDLHLVVSQSEICWVS